MQARQLANARSSIHPQTKLLSPSIQTPTNSQQQTAQMIAQEQLASRAGHHATYLAHLGEGDGAFIADVVVPQDQ